MSKLDGVKAIHGSEFSHLDIHFIWMYGIGWCIKRFRISMRSGQSVQCLISRLREMADNIDAAFKEK